MSVGMQHITATACPDCGSAKVIKFEKSHQHSNGQWNERLTFDCGLMLRYSPNFMRVAVEEDCKKSAAYLAWKEKRTVIALAMVEAAKKAASVPESVDLGAIARSLCSDLDLYRDVLEPTPK